MITLAQLIADVESSGNFQAVRFEPATYSTHHPLSSDSWLYPAVRQIARIHDADENTALMIASTSWGGFQFMGFNVYDPDLFNYHWPVSQFMEDADAQRACFDAFTRRHHIAYDPADMMADPDKLASFAHAYNGPGAVPAYTGMIRRSYARLTSSAGAP